MTRNSLQHSLSLLSLIVVSICAPAQTPKPKLTFDEFFNSVSFDALKVSPDGNSVVIGTDRADWEQQIDRKDLWLVDLETGAERQVTTLAGDFDVQDFDISADGREVILERVQERSDIVLLDLARR